jgi:predicted component of type VI protein secretion system
VGTPPLWVLDRLLELAENSPGCLMPLSLLEIYPDRGRNLDLQGGAMFGRGGDCEVRIDDPTLSRHHARVVVGETGIALEDLGSSNGLYVNGQARSGMTPLHPGDVLQLGGTVWKVIEAEVTGEGPPSSGESRIRD